MKPRAKGAVFCLMPWRIQIKAIGGVLKGRGPKAVVQPAVGDPNEMGFSAFYAAVLSHVSQTPHVHDMPPVPSNADMFACRCKLRHIRFEFLGYRAAQLCALTRCIHHPLASRLLVCSLASQDQVLARRITVGVSCLPSFCCQPFCLAYQNGQKIETERISCHVQPCSLGAVTAMLHMHWQCKHIGEVSSISLASGQIKDCHCPQNTDAR